jgi:hypothetical protein
MVLFVPIINWNFCISFSGKQILSYYCLCRWSKINQFKCLNDQLQMFDDIRLTPEMRSKIANGFTSYWNRLKIIGLIKNQLWSILSFCLLSFRLFVFLSICLFFFLSFCLFVFLSFCLFVYLSICLSVFLSFCISTRLIKNQSGTIASLWWSGMWSSSAKSMNQPIW